MRMREKRERVSRIPAAVMRVMEILLHYGYCAPKCALFKHFSHVFRCLDICIIEKSKKKKKHKLSFGLFMGMFFLNLIFIFVIKVYSQTYDPYVGFPSLSLSLSLCNGKRESKYLKMGCVFLLEL